MMVYGRPSTLKNSEKSTGHPISSRILIPKGVRDDLGLPCLCVHTWDWSYVNMTVPFL
ncbi:hypothetical protein DPMN_194529 [Dreissena polymorpha]|uniref:Uncharacterized protein n=1 Tax=Dreissena polymorpha TaxID=45954 RepID=A0A9D3Y536_DREPO|nr:hypothetical protein DPMN_194529 [Dreissena polymorpha]